MSSMDCMAGSSMPMGMTDVNSAGHDCNGSGMSAMPPTSCEDHAGMPSDMGGMMPGMMGGMMPDMVDMKCDKDEEEEPQEHAIGDCPQ